MASSRKSPIPGRNSANAPIYERSLRPPIACLCRPVNAWMAGTVLAGRRPLPAGAVDAGNAPHAASPSRPLPAGREVHGVRGILHAIVASAAGRGEKCTARDSGRAKGAGPWEGRAMKKGGAGPPEKRACGPNGGRPDAGGAGQCRAATRRRPCCRASPGRPGKCAHPAGSGGVGERLPGAGSCGMRPGDSARTRKKCSRRTRTRIWNDVRPSWDHGCAAACP